MELLDDHYCFACGNMNPAGLHLVFDKTSDRVTTVFTPQREHQGYSGLVHGGILCILLDEVMAHMSAMSGYNAATARLEVRFRKPAPVGEKIFAAATVESDRGKALTLAAELRDSLGQLIAEGRSVFVRGKEYNRQPKSPL